MISARIKIGDGQILDTREHGLIYKESDTRFEAPIKKRDTTSYAEEAGEHIDPRTVPDAFDYTVQFIVLAHNKNLQNANHVIAMFNRLLYTRQRGSDIRTYEEVTFYNDFKRVKIVGIPEPIAEAEKLYRRQNGEMMDCAVVKLKIRVTDPSRCDFNMSV